jgi:hypothetical protein
MTIGRPANSRILAVLAAALLAGCSTGPTAKFAVNRAPDYHAEPKRLFVMAYNLANDFSDDFYERFKAKLARNTKACGADFAMATAMSLDIDPNIHLARLERFGPDAVLTLQHPEGVIGQEVGGLVFRMIYEAALIERPGGRIVWRANIDFYPGSFGSSQGTIGEALADQLTGEFRNEAIFRSCPAKP